MGRTVYIELYPLKKNIMLFVVVMVDIKQLNV